MLFGKPKRVVKRILIVEDEPLTAFDNETMLSDAGYEVVATLDGYEAALARIERGNVDLVLSDVRLASQRTGIDLARAAKERGIPTFLASGQRYPEAQEVAIGCIHKPYNERQLKAALKAVDDHLSGRKVHIPDGVELFDRPPA